MALHKKGQVMNVIVGLIIFLVGLGIILLIITGYQFSITKSIDRTICKMSVLLKYGSVKSYFGFYEGQNINCKIEEVKLNTKTETLVMETLAEQMSRCWWKLGEGEIDFLSNIDVGFSDSRCIICSKINAKNENFESAIPIKDFADYLNTNSYKFGEEKTYASYFYGAEDSQVDFGNEGSIVIDDEFSNYVVFIANKRGDIYDTLNALGIVGVAGTTTSALIKPVATGKGLLKGGSFVFKNILKPKVLLTRVALPVAIVGAAIDFSYAPDLYSTLVLAPGEETVNRCDRLE